MDYKVSKNSIKDMGPYFDRKKKYLIVVDDFIFNNYKAYIESLKNLSSGFLYRVPSGESSKNSRLAFDIIDFLLDHNFTRDDLIVNLGGGVVTDLGGFVASIYMRGIDYINIPTTLLSQVDSSLGGKVGINYRSYKNIVGNFKEPQAVFIDTNFLESLDQGDLLSGYGEILKYGIIEDEKLFFQGLESYKNSSFLEKDLEAIIKKSIEIKLGYTSRDFRDRGLRQILNFGHSIGHGLEGFTDFKNYSHGEAVIVGMIYETYIGYRLATIDEESVATIIENLRPLVSLRPYDSQEVEKIMSLIGHDKKNTGGTINMVLPRALGSAFLYNNVPEEVIMEALKGDWIEN